MLSASVLPAHVDVLEEECRGKTISHHGNLLHRNLPSRFLIEYIKNVQVASEYEMIATYGINMGQLLSIPFILLGIGLVIWAMSHPRQHWTFPNKFAEEIEAERPAYGRYRKQ